MAASDPFRWYDWVPVVGAVDIAIRRREFAEYNSRMGNEFLDLTSSSKWNVLAWYQSIATATAVIYPFL